MNTQNGSTLAQYHSAFQLMTYLLLLVLTGWGNFWHDQFLQIFFHCGLAHGLGRVQIPKRGPGLRRPSVCPLTLWSSRGKRQNARFWIKQNPWLPIVRQSFPHLQDQYAVLLLLLFLSRRWQSCISRNKNSRARGKQTLNSSKQKDYIDLLPLKREVRANSTRELTCLLNNVTNLSSKTASSPWFMNLNLLWPFPCVYLLKHLSFTSL